MRPLLQLLATSSTGCIYIVSSIDGRWTFGHFVFRYDQSLGLQSETKKNQCKNIVNAEDEEMLKFSRRLKFEIEVEVAATTKVLKPNFGFSLNFIWLWTKTIVMCPSSTSLTLKMSLLEQ